VMMRSWSSDSPVEEYLQPGATTANNMEGERRITANIIVTKVTSKYFTHIRTNKHSTAETLSQRKKSY